MNYVLIKSIHPSVHFTVCVCVCVCVSVCLWPSASDWTAYQILVTLRIGVLYRKLSCKLEFHENLHIDSHTLLKGINGFLPIISLWLSCLKNGIEDLCEMLLSCCELFLKWCSTSCTLCINDSFQHFLWFGYSLVQGLSIKALRDNEFLENQHSEDNTLWFKWISISICHIDCLKCLQFSI